MQILKKIFSIVLRIAISIILLFFLFKQIDNKSLFEIIKKTDKPLLLLALLIFFLNYTLCLFRWQMLLKTVNIHIPLKRIIISFSGGVFFSLFLPSTIGGDIMRSIDLAAHTKKPREVIATILLDRLSGYVALVIVALLALLAGWRLVQDFSTLLAVSVITGVLIAILLVLFNKFIYSKVNKFLHSPNAGKIRGAIKNLHQEIHVFQHHKKVIIKNLALSILVQVISPLTFYIIALSVGVRINIIYFLVFLPIIGAVTMLPISIGGLGLRDAMTIFFFAKAGVGKDLSFAMSLLNFSFILIYSAIGGLIYVLTLHHRRIQYHQPSAVHSKS